MHIFFCVSKSIMKSRLLLLFAVTLLLWTAEAHECVHDRLVKSEIPVIQVNYGFGDGGLDEGRQDRDPSDVFATADASQMDLCSQTPKPRSTSSLAPRKSKPLRRYGSSTSLMSTATASASMKETPSQPIKAHRSPARRLIF